MDSKLNYITNLFRAVPGIEEMHIQLSTPMLYIHFQTLNVYWAHVLQTQTTRRPFNKCLCNNTIFRFLVKFNQASVPRSIEINVSTFNNEFHTT